MDQRLYDIAVKWYETGTLPESIPLKIQQVFPSGIAYLEKKN